MKTSKLNFHLNLIVCLLGLLITSCTEEELMPLDVISNQQSDQWQEIIPDLIFDSSIIVPVDGSVQEAVNAAQPGEAIIIEAGAYQEDVTIEKAGLILIGLDGTNGEKVVIENMTTTNSNVEIVNIQKANEAFISQRPKVRTKNRFFHMTRRQVARGIAHYQFLVRLGGDEFDLVKIHRVVKEYRPYQPVRTEGAVFMVHGAQQDFDDIFLQAGNEQLPTAQTSSPVYLAANHIDVWGIDLGWTRVPVETSDFSFMADWGVERDVDHTLASMTIARLIRGLTGQGFGRLNLLGFSYGVAVSYAAAGRETQQRRIKRDIKGLIAVDGLIKYAPEDDVFRATACDRSAGILAMINSGVFHQSNGLQGILFGELALNAPDEPSDFIPGLTNFQSALFIGTNASPAPQAPFWHFVAGDLTEPTDIPNELLYTDPDRWFRLLASLAPYQPLQTLYDLTASQCDEVEVSIDDHLAEIRVPILYLGAGGGNGGQGNHNSSLTASTDISHYIASLEPPEKRFIDFGHADLFLANNADQLVWEVLRQWLAEHGKYAS